MKKHHLVTFLTLATATGAILIQGCATSPTPSKMVWYNPNRSPQDKITDEAECRNMVRVNQQGVPMDEGAATILGIFAESKREKDIYSDCMVAKGYTLISTNSPLLKTIPIADVDLIAFEKAKADKGDADAQFDLGNLYYTGYTNNVCGVAKDYTESIKWFQKAAAQNYPGIQFPLAKAYVRRGALYQSEEAFAVASADYNEAIKIKPDFTEAYLLRGVIELCNEDNDGALKDFNQAIELNPKSGFGYYYRALIKYNSHNFMDAFADYSTCCQVGSNAEQQAYSRFYIWIIRARMGDQDAGTAELQAYLTNSKSEKWDDWWKTIALFLTGQIKDSDFLNVAATVDTKLDTERHCEAYFYAGTKQLIGGNRLFAEDYFEKCVSTGSRNSDEYRSAAAELQFLKASK